MDWRAQLGKTVTDGHGTHEVVGYWEGPVVVIRDVETGAEQTFGVSGLTAQRYYPAINAPGDYDHHLGGYR